MVTMNRTDKEHAEKMRAALKGRKIVEVRLQLRLSKNNAEWLDFLAMLLRDEPIAFHEDEDGYEDEDKPLGEGELHERYVKEEKRLINRYYA